GGQRDDLTRITLGGRECLDARRRGLLPSMASLGVGEAASLAPNEIEVPRVDKDAGRFPKDEYRIEPVETIGKQGQSPTYAEQPERDGNDAPSAPLRGDPLDQEAHGEERLSHKADR